MRFMMTWKARRNARRLLNAYKVDRSELRLQENDTPERYFTADVLRLADTFSRTFHFAAIADAFGERLRGEALEQRAAAFAGVSVDDVRDAVATFTEFVPLEEWITAASSKHDMPRMAAEIAAANGVVAGG
jgi:hypothetical protein